MADMAPWHEPLIWIMWVLYRAYHVNKLYIYYYMRKPSPWSQSGCNVENNLVTLQFEAVKIV